MRSLGHSQSRRGLDSTTSDHRRRSHHNDANSCRWQVVASCACSTVQTGTQTLREQRAEADVSSLQGDTCSIPRNIRRVDLRAVRTLVFYVVFLWPVTVRTKRCAFHKLSNWPPDMPISGHGIARNPLLRGRVFDDRRGCQLELVFRTPQSRTRGSAVRPARRTHALLLLWAHDLRAGVSRTLKPAASRTWLCRDSFFILED